MGLEDPLVVRTGLGDSELSVRVHVTSSRLKDGTDAGNLGIGTR